MSKKLVSKVITLGSLTECEERKYEEISSFLSEYNKEGLEE